MVPRERMTDSARKLRDTYAITPGLPLFRMEFGFYSLERWKKEGLPQDGPQAGVFARLFHYDPPGDLRLFGLGWCEAAFVPAFEIRITEDRGEYEVVQDVAGRHVLYFKGRRSGFMPEYLTHPVKDKKSWEENVKWRLNPDSPERYADLDAHMQEAVSCAGKGMMTVQYVIGGYMYLRSLIGPEGLLYAFYDMPDVVHDCMGTWLRLADAVIARHQRHVTIDVLYFAEDICYNHGALISPDMMKEFLFPYYQQLIHNVKSRQLDKARPFYMQVDTDGFSEPVIPLYREAIGLRSMLPFEVASGCDVVAIGRQYPDLVISGGIDKRIIAMGPPAIDRHLESILPVMRERGGYIPTCDHGVPEETSYEKYLYYRERCIELGG
jgi:Uroporphyrinogen decarboxylase (URO-D)